MRLLISLCSFTAFLTLSQVAEAVTVRMKLSWIRNDQYAGQIVAYNMGLYKKENIELILMSHESGAPDPYDSVISGKADVGVGETLVVLRKAIKDGSDIVIFGIEDQISPAGFLSLVDKGLKQPVDIENRTFGYYNNSDTDLLKWYTDRNKINYNSIKKLKITPNDMEPLIGGIVDFIIAHETNEPVLLKLNNHQTNFISLSGPKGFLFGPCYFCRRDYFEKHKEVLKKLIKVTSHGWRIALANPREAASIIVGQYPKHDYIKGSKKITMDKFVKSLAIKKYYLTYKVGIDCICCMSKFYWDMVKERLISEGLMDNGSDILNYVKYDATQALVWNNE